MSEKVFLRVYDNRSTTALIDIPHEKGLLNDYVFILAHGASNDLRHSLLKGVVGKINQLGGTCLRFNFLYRESGLISDKIKDENLIAYQKAFEYAKERFEDKKIIACGKSLGAKVAISVCVKALIDPYAVIVFGYPLHPKYYLNKIKNSLVLECKKDIFFILGSKDPLSRLDLFEKYIASNGYEYKIVDGGDHGLAVDGRYSALSLNEIVLSIECWLTSI